VTVVLNSAVLILMMEYTFVFAGVEAHPPTPELNMGTEPPNSGL
jgi:hypothetical protein